jgi:hypothetical protein
MDRRDTCPTEISRFDESKTYLYHFRISYFVIPVKTGIYLFIFSVTPRYDASCFYFIKFKTYLNSIWRRGRIYPTRYGFDESNPYFLSANKFFYLLPSPRDTRYTIRIWLLNSSLRNTVHEIRDTYLLSRFHFLPAPKRYTLNAIRYPIKKAIGHLVQSGFLLVHIVFPSITI